MKRAKLVSWAERQRRQAKDRWMPVGYYRNRIGRGIPCSILFDVGTIESVRFIESPSAGQSLIETMHEVRRQVDEITRLPGWMNPENRPSPAPPPETPKNEAGTVLRPRAVSPNEEFIPFTNDHGGVRFEG